MGKLKDIWNGEHRSFVRYAVWSTAVFLVIVTFFGHSSLIRWARAGIELRRQQRQVEVYRQEIERMDAQIGRLSNDRDTLEKFARENFGFAAPGEDVYLETR